MKDSKRAIVSLELSALPGGLDPGAVSTT